MIVTFHIAVYFAYYIWNTYISHHISDNQSTQNNAVNDEPESQSEDKTKSKSANNAVSKEALDAQNNGVTNSASGADQSRENTNKSLDENKEDLSKKIIPVSKEGEGDFHPCLPQIFSDEDKGSDMIYNVEPEYGCICTDKKIQFFPPVYIQRYMEIERILKDPKWARAVRKVVDFGCAELNFETRYLKKLHGIEEIVAVDIDTDTLEYHCCKLGPHPSDFLNKRPTPLSVRVFKGSVAHTHDALVGADAVIAIELIEHLFPPELECLPFTVFGFIRPKIAIFTTPNSDFNVLFSALSGFRHPDHKFEWSQHQFEDWAHNLVERYPDYQVRFKGIGPGPQGSEDLGCCSQMATFIKVNESSSTPDFELHVQDGPYTLISEKVFPFFKDERTDEEKIRDSAECFLINCKMRSRIYDNVKSEIPIKSVMERIKYYDREKLKQILKARKWEIKINSSEEVVILPDSEEEEDLEPECNEYINDDLKSLDDNYIKNIPEIEENWDSEEGFCTDLTFTTSPQYLYNNQISCETSVSDHVCMPNVSYSEVTENTNFDFIDSTIAKPLSSDKLNCSCNEKCSILETNVPDSEFSDKVNSIHIGSVLERDTNLNFEKSIYETPHNNDFSNHLKSNCDLCDCSLPLLDESVKGCKRALVMVMEPSKELTRFEVNTQSENPFCCVSNISSSCDTSIYATPCCSDRHKNNIPKCLSLQQISICGSPAFTSEPETEIETLDEGKSFKKPKDIFSQSVEGIKSLENDFTCSSTSIIIDSGYPDSNSEYNMDMDLTPEQFEDIETESEENEASSRSLSPPLPPPPIPWLIDDVQNGDVANNNRDGEGNNLVANMEEEHFEFEARIDVINNEVLNMAPANNAIDFDHDMLSGEPHQENCGDCLPCTSDSIMLLELTNGDQCMAEKSPNQEMSKLKSVFTEKNLDLVLSDSLDKQSLRSTKSDTSIATNYSWTLDPTEGQVSCKSEGVTHYRKAQTPKLKTHSSLTTVLDGYSKFSSCSLVHPVEVYQVTEQENNSPLRKSLPGENRDPFHQDSSVSDPPAPRPSTELQDERQSLMSIYQSAESLNIVRELPNENQNENTFPDWLLKILISNGNEIDSLNSAQSTLDSDSIESIGDGFDSNDEIQVDARGGGDPQSDTWN